MQLSKLTAALTTATMAVAMLGGTAAAAQAAPVQDDTDSVVAFATKQLTRFGVPVSTRDALIAKIRRGQALDADAGTHQVSETTSDQGVTRHVYADGSVAESSIETPDNAAGAKGKGINGCVHSQFQDQHTYKNCRISWDAASWSMEYWADYGYYQFGSTMMSVRGLRVEGGGSFSSPNNTVVVSSCNSSCDTWGQGTALQAISISGVGIARTIGIKVANNNSNKKGGKSSSIGQTGTGQ